jgi:hypothetical protein
MRSWMRPFLLGVEPPDKPVTRPAARRFARDLLARTLLITIPGWIVAILVSGSAWLALAAAVMIAAGIADLVYLSVSLRRLERGGKS